MRTYQKVMCGRWVTGACGLLLNECWQDTCTELHTASAENTLSLVMALLMKVENNPLADKADRFIAAVLSGLEQRSALGFDLTTFSLPLKRFTWLMVLVICEVWPELEPEQTQVIEAVETVLV